jgi:hypothetical protein
MSRHGSAEIIEAVLAELVKRGELVQKDDRVGLPGTVELSHRQRQWLDVLLAECVAAGATPPTLKEFAAKSGCGLKDLEPLVQVAVDEGRLVRLSPEMAIDAAALRLVRSASVGGSRANTRCRFSSSSIDSRSRPVRATFIPPVRGFPSPSLRRSYEGSPAAKPASLACGRPRAQPA